jgi:hypothetical protein
MISKISRTENIFDKYFREADDESEDDKVSVTVAPRENRGTDYTNEDPDKKNITVAPRKNRGTEYSSDDSDEEQTSETEEPESGSSDDGGDDEATDYTQSDDESSDESREESSEDNSDSSNEESHEDTKAAQKKYNTYTKFLHLYKAIGNYLDKLRNIVKDDNIENVVIKRVTSNLNTIYDALYTYMIMKYKDATYIEILTYYETVINCVKLNFELLKNNNIKLKQ